MKTREHRKPPRKYQRTSWVTELTRRAECEGEEEEEDEEEEEEEEKDLSIISSILDIPPINHNSTNKENEAPQEKNQRNSHNWIYQFILKTSSGYSCGVNDCDQVWFTSKTKILQSGNIKRHMVRKHRDEILDAGISIKSVKNQEKYTSEQLNQDIMELIAVRCLPLNFVDEPLFRGI